MRRNFVLLALTFVVITVGTVTANPKHAKYGVNLPYLGTLKSSTPGDSLLVGKPDLAQELWLSVSDKGRVTHVSSNRVVSTDFQSRLLGWLSRLAFEPGRINGKKTAMQLPVYLFLSAIDSTASLILPTDSLGHVVDYNLFAKADSAAGVQLPAVDYFPWYHAVFSKGDTSKILRYVLISTVLGSQPTPVSVDLAATNFPAFADQIVIATNWGKFSPVIGPELRAYDTVFVLVTLFPSTKYPNTPWTPARLDSLDLQERLAIRLLVDTAGSIMIPPIPKTRRDSLLSIKYPSDREASLVPVEIDTSGIVKPVLDSAKAPKAYASAGALVNQLAFYPAVDFRGRAVRFRGFLEIIPTGESSIRVRCWWLQPE